MEKFKRRYRFLFAIMVLCWVNSCSACEFKTVNNGENNSADSRIKDVFPVNEIYKTLSSNKNYTLKSYSPDNYLIVDNVSEGIRYSMLFSNSQVEDNEGYRFKLSATNKGNYGVPCSISDTELKNHVYNIINDFPITPEHKDKLKRKVTVSNARMGHIY